MINADQQQVLAAARWYAEHYGWAIIPGRAADKRPGINEWNRNASKDDAQIQAWWSEMPDSIVGLHCGMSKMIVIDIDVHDERANGFQSWAAALHSIGRDLEWFDGLTVHSTTGGGGKHYFFEAPDDIDLTKRKIALMPGVDVLVGTSFVVLPPSPHPSGRKYAWADGARPTDRAVAALPSEIRQLLIKSSAIDEHQTTRAMELADILANGSGSGRRNDDLVRLVGWLRRVVGDTEEAHVKIREQIEQWRDKCEPVYRGTLEDAEFERSWLSALALDHSDIDRVYDGDLDADVADVAAMPGWTPVDLADWLVPRLAGRVREDTDGALWLWMDDHWVKDDRTGGWTWKMVHWAWHLVRAWRDAVSQQALALEGQGDQRQADGLRKFGNRMMERKVFTDAVKSAAEKLDKIPAKDWDAHAELFHCANGVLDLRTGTLRQHDPALLNTRLCPTAFVPIRKEPDGWADMLEMMMPGRSEMQQYVRAALGYSLFGNNDQKALFILHGEADNGKSTLMAALGRILGSYFGTIEKEVLVESRYERHPQGRADAYQRRIGKMSGEWTSQDKLNLDVVKAMTGGDPENARGMYESSREFEARVTPWICTNNQIRLREFDVSIRSRVKLIELNGTIPDDRRREQQDVIRDLTSQGEAEGMLRWIVNSMLDAGRAGGLKAIEPVELQEAVAEMFDDQDLVKQWLEDWTVDLRTLGGRDEDLRAACVEQGLTLTELHVSYELHKGQIDKNLFAQRVAKLLRVNARKDLPRAMRGGKREHLYPVRWSESGSGYE